MKLADILSTKSLDNLLYAARATEIAKLPKKHHKGAQAIVLKKAN